MATTLTMALLTGDTLEVAHVGHSRCYLHRQGRLNRVTRDHTMAELFAGQGVCSPSYVHMLYNAIGGDLPAVKPELHRMTLEPDDLILLCTDGLTRHLADEEIAALLGRGGGAATTCEALVAAANAAGGEDNVTVVLACM
jgi:protein phosphatase